MPEQDTKIRKFLFDANNFDMRPEDMPPVFSSDELGAARQEAFEQGRRAGHAEAAAQREKLVADLLGRITQNFSTLFEAESRRAGLYEAETLFLARAIFGRLFPGLNERHGLDEVTRAITTVLEGQRAQPEIVIEVHPDYTGDIRQFLSSALKAANEGICTVTGNPDLGPGDCRMRWEDGGATRSATRICEQIAHVFEQTLADRPILRDNGGDSSDTKEPPAGDE
jgi:flagellar assembly protein FliH